MSFDFINLPPNAFRVLEESINTRPVVPDTSTQIRDAILYNGEYAAARNLQAGGNGDAVKADKTNTIAKHHLKLLRYLDTGDSESTQRRLNFVKLMHQKGLGDNIDLYDHISPLTYDDRDAFENAWLYTVAERVQYYQDQSGVGEKFWNFIKSIVPVDEALDRAEVVNSSWWTIAKDMRSEVARIQSLPWDERVLELEKFEQKAIEAHDGNMQDVANTLSLLSMSPADVAEDIRFDQALSMFVIADVVGGVTGLSAALLRKIRNPAVIAKDAESLKEMARLIEADDTMTASEKAASLHVLQTESIFANSVDGSLAPMKERLDRTFDSMGETFAGLRSWVLRREESRELMERTASGLPSELNTAYNKALTHIDEISKRYLDEYGEILEYEVTSVGREGMEVTYRVHGMEGREKIKFSLNDQGMLDVTEMSRLDALKSPAHVFGEKLYGQALAITGEKSRLANVLQRELDDAMKPVRGNPFARSRVEAVLRQGDVDGGVYSLDDLRAGVEVTGKGGTKRKVTLSDKEIEAYYGVRRFQDEIGWFTNYSVYEKKAGEGVMTVRITGEDRVLVDFFDEFGDGTLIGYESREGAEEAIAALYNKPVSHLTDGEKSLVVQGKDGWKIKFPRNPVTRDMEAKPYLQKDSALASVNKRGELDGNFRVFDSRSGGVEVLTQNLIDDLYESGMVLARTGDTHYLKGKTVGLVAVPKTNIKPLSQIQLNFHKGYVPRIATNTEYAVWRVAKSSGGPAYRKLDRMFNTRTEALAYAAARSAGSKKFTYAARHLKDLTGKELEEMVTETMGGAFVGKRTKPPKFGAVGTGAQIEYAKPFSAIMQNIDFLSNNLPINVWRQEVKKQWFNTVDHIANKLGVTRKQILSDPTDFHSRIALDPSNRHAVALEKQRDYILDLMRIPSTQERVFQAAARHSAEFLEKFIVGDLKIPLLSDVAKGARNLSLSFSSKDPFSLIRTATFHPMLGAFNVSQLVVQAFGASIVMAMHPLQAPRRFKEMMAMSTVRFMDHRSPGFSKAVETVAKAAGIDPKEFAFMVTAYRKSGLVDTVLMNADYAAAVEGYGLTRTAFRKLLDTGTVFYQAGERFNLEYTFLQAFANWRGKFPKAPLNDKSIMEILKETKRIGMDMGPANKAFYQKGWMSVPTQFTQVFWKFWGNMFGKRWTNQEKIMVGLSQPLLFGMAGVGAFTPEWMVNGIEQLAGGQGGLSVAGKRTIREGMFGILADSLGLDADMAYRLAISGQDNILTAAIKNGGLRVDDAGPWVAMVGRYAKSIGHTFDILVNPGVFVSNPSLIKEAAFEWFKDAARVTSMYNNYEKGMALYEYGRYFSRNGAVVSENLDWIGDEVMAASQMMGAPPSEVAETFRRRKQTRTITTILKDTIGELKRVDRKYMQKKASLVWGSPEYIEVEEKRRAAMEWVMLRYGWHDKEQQKFVGERLFDSYMKQETVEDQEMMEYIRYFAGDLQAPTKQKLEVRAIRKRDE